MKYAFMTMDVESLYDIDFIKKRNIKYDESYSMEESIKDYIKLLDKNNIKGTFFLLLSSLNKVKEYLIPAVKNNHEVALHGLDHKPIINMDLTTFQKNIIDSKKEIESILNTKIIGYRAPYFGINDSNIEILKMNGFRYDSSSLNFHLAINSSKLNLNDYERISNTIYKKNNFYEITPNRVKAYTGHLVVSGGGYIRLIPWFVIKYYIKKCIKKTDTFMFYVHPYDLNNKKLPKIDNLKFIEKLYLKIGRKSYLKKIDKIIKYLKKKGFEFKSLKQYVEAN